MSNQIIIDVREPREYATGHIAGSINIPPAELMMGSDQLAKLDKNDELVLYCISGARSNTAINILRSQGFTNLTNGMNKEQVAAQYSLDIVT